MNYPNTLENIAAYNEESLGDLARSLLLSQGAFSLIYARCNYGFLREKITELLRHKSSVKFEELVLDKSTANLYTAISNFCEERSPDALMVFGLESVANLDILLELANRVRDEFRRFPFPIVLWVTNPVLKKLIRQASDFNTYASSPISFSLPYRELTGFLSKKVEKAFAGDDNFQIDLTEIEAFQGDLQSSESELDEESKAYLAFLVGWAYGRNNRIDAAVEKYRECLEFWQEEKNALRRGIVQLYLAKIYKKNELGRHYFEEAFNSFARANRRDLVATHISKLAALLQQLGDWQSLEEVVINEALPLHQDDPMKQSEDYGFLAFAAIQESKWREAGARAESALEALAKEDGNIALPRYWSLYLFIFAQAKLQLNEVKKGLDSLKKAFNYLEAAREQNLSKDRAKLWLAIIEDLQISLTEKRQYLEAFKCKLIVREIKSQYEWIAFIGAGILQPSLKVINADEKTSEEKSNIRREIMEASGRQPDLERLIERIKNTGRKLTVIYGQSGVGKTSLLQGGLVPVLELDNFDERDYLPVLLRRYQSWDRELINELNKKHESLEECLEYFRQNRRCLIVLIFDQFEEFFFDNPDAGTREKFYNFLDKCLEIDYFKVVFSLREDYLHYFFEPLRKSIDSKIDTGYGDIFYYLGDLKREDARGIIESLTARSPVPLKLDLISQLLEDLAGELEGVRPIELQIVGSKLETAKITTLTEYKELGKRPKERLVKQFLEEAVKDCGEENQKAAELVLFLLTNDEEKRPLKTARELKEDLEGLEVKAEKLDLVLKVLVGSGLVLLVPETPEDFYQLVHDYFVRFVRQKYEPQSLELQRAQEQRRQEEKQRRRAEKRLLFGSVAASLVMAVLATAATTFGVQAYQQRQLADQQRQLAEEQRREAKEQLNKAIKESSIASANESQALIFSKRPFKAGLAAIKAGTQIIAIKLLPPTDRFSVITDSLRQIASSKKGKLFLESDELRGHKGVVWGVSFSPDGDFIATVSSDKSVKLWSRDGTLTQTLTGHQDAVWGVRFSDNGDFATGSSDEMLIIWSRDGNKLKTLRGHEGWIYGLSFSPDGKFIATASVDKTVKIWSSDGKELHTLTGHEGEVNAVSFSPDGKLIASASFDKTVKVWSIDGRELQTLRGRGIMVQY